MNRFFKIGFIVTIIFIIIGLGTLSTFDNTSSQNIFTVDVILENYFDGHVVPVPVDSIFNVYYTEKDFFQFQKNFSAPEDDAKIEFKDKNSELYKNLQPNKNTNVI